MEKAAAADQVGASAVAGRVVASGSERASHVRGRAMHDLRCESNLCEPNEGICVDPIAEGEMCQEEIPCASNFCATASHQSNAAFASLSWVCVQRHGWRQIPNERE